VVSSAGGGSAPAPQPTLGHVLRAAAQRWPDREAVVDDHERLTYRDLAAAAGAVRRALEARGVGPGDRVAVIGPNSARWVAVAHGVWDAGAVIVPLSTRLRGYEIGQALARVGATCLCTVDELLGVRYVDVLRAEWGGAAGDRPVQGLPDLAHVVALDDAPGSPGVVGWQAFLDGAGPASAEGPPSTGGPAAGPHDLAEVLFTSGTTGAPKGVALDHEQLVRSYWDWSGIGGLVDGDRFLVISPFSHGFGINAGIVACALRGMTIVTQALYDPARALDVIEREAISVISGPPSLFARLLELPDFSQRGAPSLRVAFLGAASVPGTLISALRAEGLDRVINAYGLIESCVVTMTRAEDPVEVIAGSTGRPAHEVEVRTVDDDGVDTGVDEPGEVLVRGFGVMRRYWDDPVATAEAVDADGWLRTGDVGALDEAGNLRIVDRKKDMFIVNGFNAYPAEIEQLLLRHPDLAQAAVVGVPDEGAGEVGWAYVVAADGAGCTPEDLVAWARTAMANYKAPRRVELVDALPLNANGKVDKGELRRRAGAALGSGAAGAGAPSGR
jgi:acyl-CoA synthetase (AMP-forming)/AMP-acid ligase II